MRGLLLALLLPLAFAGCVADDATPVSPQAAPEAVAGPVERESIEIGTLGFTLGPAGNTQVTQSSATLSGVAVPENATSVVVFLKFSDGVTADFTVEGIDGCEIRIAGPQQATGTELSQDCSPAAGAYDLKMTHQTGHVRGTVRVVANFG